MFAFRVVPDSDRQTTFLGAIQKALVLGRKVKLVLGAVGDVHGQFAFFQIQPVDHLNRVFQAHLGGNVGTALVQGVGDIVQLDDDDPVEPADDLVALGEIGTPAPAAGV